jgi:NADH dehydrogenase/NADH:ubiquinone oxidoreductase subunit G
MTDTQTHAEPGVIVDPTDPVDLTAGRAETDDILDIVDDLIVHLHEAKTMPLSSNALVDRELFLTRLERLRASLPDELRAARWMVREREAFISRTNEKSREIVDNARQEADALVAESNIVAEAVEEANILVRRAEGEARRLRLEAEDDIERKLQRMEHLLVELTSQVQSSRAEFHQARPRPPEVPI